MMTEGYQEDLLLLHHFLLQEKPPVSEGKTMTMKTVKMRKICFSLPPDLVVRRRGTLHLGVCVGSLQEVYAGRWCWAPQGGERQKGENPSHSLWRQAEEGEREEMQPALGWSLVKGRIHLVTGGAEEEEGCLGLAKETAVGMRMGFLLWHFLSLKAEVLACPIGHLHMEPLQQLPGRLQRPRSEQETGNAGKAVRGPEGQVWHLWGRAES